jgi:hypothetical protein
MNAEKLAKSLAVFFLERGYYEAQGSPLGLEAGKNHAVRVNSVKLTHYPKWRLLAKT